MKMILAWMMLFVCLTQGQDSPKEFDRLETKAGKVYEHAKVRKIEPDGISIIHDAGTAKVPFEGLSPELQIVFGYDPQKAAVHRESVAADAANLATSEAESAARYSAKVTASKKADADIELTKKVKALASLIAIDGYQMSNSGILAMISVMRMEAVPIKGSRYEMDHRWVFDYKVDGILRGADGVKVGRASGSILWDGKGWRIGKIQYLTSRGLLRTCPLFTASEKEATSFFRSNGFGKTSLDVVKKSY